MTLFKFQNLTDVVFSTATQVQQFGKISWSKGPIDTIIMSTQKLLSRLQSGLGATKLSSNVTKISVSLAMKGKNECAGARYIELKPVCLPPVTNNHTDFLNADTL